MISHVDITILIYPGCLFTYQAPCLVAAHSLYGRLSFLREKAVSHIKKARGDEIEHLAHMAQGGTAA